MILRFIERGTSLQISLETELDAESSVYDATFHDLYDHVNETSFIVQCSKLNKDFSKIDQHTVLNIRFSRGQYMYAFTGRLSGKMYNDMVIIDVLTSIETLNRRVYERDEIRVEVKIYGLPEEQIPDAKHMKPVGKPAMTDVSFDISSGGLCVITNSILQSEFDPYYLVDFSLGEWDQFLLPSRLVRNSNYARTKIGKYDYGFEFIFDNLPDEKSRLTKSILSRKLSYSRVEQRR